MKRNAPTLHSDQVRAAAIPWFLEEDFTDIKAIMEDAVKLHKTWVEWHVAAQKFEKLKQASGVITIRVVLRPVEFVDFCRKRGLRLDAHARSQFAALGAMEQYGKTH